MKIEIPAALRRYAGGAAVVEAPGRTVADGLAVLTERYPELRKNIFTDDGRLRQFVNVYLNDEDLRYLPAKEQSAAKESDVVTILPSIAGG